MRFHILFRVGDTKLPVSGAAIWTIDDKGDQRDLVCTTGSDGIAQYDPELIEGSAIRITALGYSSQDRLKVMPSPPIILERINSSAYTGFAEGSICAYWKEKGGERWYQFFADGTMRSNHGSDLTRYRLNENVKGRYSTLEKRSFRFEPTSKYVVDRKQLCMFRFPKPAVMLVKNDMMGDDEAIEFELVN